MIESYKYTEKEKEELFNNVVILVDTREHEGANEHILDYFRSKNIEFKKKKLDYGDYSFMIKKNEKLNIPRDLYFDKKIVVERKGSAEELSGNLSKERDRLEKEFALAPKEKILLIENSTYEDIVNGNYQTQYNAKSFWASLHSLMAKYNLKIQFMKNKKYSGIFIWGYFKYYLKNYLR